MAYGDKKISGSAEIYKRPPTEQEIRNLSSNKINEFIINDLLTRYGYKPMAHDSIDAAIEENDIKDFDPYGLGHPGPWTGKGAILNLFEKIFQPMIARPVNGNWENKVSIDDILSRIGRTPQEEKTLLDSLSNHTNMLVPEVGSLRYKENIKK